ncbi:MAG TPA: hypothetical protein VHZ51_20810, partial [Ktedonobacteraceae bacterium]|nr:hypothetical protein [Ktedonobacteraceae bacterium]
MADDQDDPYQNDFTPVNRPGEQEADLPPQSYFEQPPQSEQHPSPVPYNQPYVGQQQEPRNHRAMRLQP